MIKNFLNKDIFIFCLMTLFIAYICVFYRFAFPDLDFFNYHFYNGYAFLNNRLDVDFMPANYRTYLNPYMDAGLYYLISKFNNHPVFLLTVFSLDNSLFLFLVYKISKTLFNVENKIMFSLISVFYIAFSPILLDSLNFTLNDVLVGNFILISFYILILTLFRESKARLKLIFLAGAVLGIGAGLKLTLMLYLVTFTVSVFFMYKKVPDIWKVLICFISGFSLAFLIVDGWWIYKVWTMFQSPMFPYNNHIFKSPYFDFININKIDYSPTVPRNFFEFIFYPFLWSDKFIFGNYHLDWDPRYAVNFICSLYLFYLILRRKQIFYIEKEHLCFLLLFLTSTYYFNCAYAGTYRFIVPVSALYGITLIVFLGNLFRKNYETVLIVLFIVTGYVYMKNTYNFSFKHYNPLTAKTKFFEVSPDIDFEDNSKVIFVSVYTSYLAVNKNKNAKYYSYVIPAEIYDDYKRALGYGTDIYYNTRIMFSKYLSDLLSDILKDKEQKVYVVFFNDDEKNIHSQILKYYSDGQRKLRDCKKVRYESAFTDTDFPQPFVCEYNFN